jgi:tetratricopeptide (TPR) repeat protein
MIKTYILLILIVLWVATSCEKFPNHTSDHIAWADSTAERATNLMDGAQAASSLTYLDSAYESLPKPGIGDLWKKYNVKASYYTHYGHDFVKRRMYVDSMLTILENVKTKYRYEYAHSLYVLAELLQEEKQYNQAFKAYFDGRNFSKGSLDNCSMSDFTNALGIVRYRQEQYRQAIPYLKQALTEIKSCSNPAFQYGFIQHQSILNSIARVSKNPASRTPPYFITIGRWILSKRAPNGIHTSRISLRPHVPLLKGIWGASIRN